MEEYFNFEIVFGKTDKVDIYSATVKGACGDKGDGDIAFETAEIRRFVAENSDPDEKPFTEENAKELGELLTAAIFRGDFLHLWGKCDDCRPLRIRLDMSATPELATMPWEYLRLPGIDGDFIGLDPTVTLVRYLRTMTGSGPLKIKPPLRILLAASAPANARQLDLDIEIEEIRKALKNLGDQNFSITVMEYAATELLERTLEQASDDYEPFHVFHFIGHADYMPDTREGMLVFEENEAREDGGRNYELVSHQELARILKPYSRDLRLVVLNACETALGASTNVYSSVAAKVVQNGIQAAIGMQHKIPDQGAIVFAEALYTQLAAGEPLEYAVDRGRIEISKMGGGCEAWATPVFYLRSPDGNLFDIERPKVLPGVLNDLRPLKPYFMQCKVVMFLGMGVNLSNRFQRDHWKPELNVGLPNMAELTAYLGETSNAKNPTCTLAGLAQWLRVNDIDLTSDLIAAFSGPMKSTGLYNTLGTLTKKITDRLPEVPVDRAHPSVLYVTTTYDCALENALIKAGIPGYHTIRFNLKQRLFTHQYYEGADPEPRYTEPLTNPHYNKLTDRLPVILKLPGEVRDLESDYAIAEDDFFILAGNKFTDLLPKDIMSQIDESYHVYLGYDIENWTLRLLLTQLCENHNRSKYKSYAVVRKDEMMDMFWKKLAGTRTDASIGDYVAGLEKFVRTEF